MGFEGLKFYDSQAETSLGVNHLPHWEQEGRTYFVTFRTADSLPSGLMAELQNRLNLWLQHHPKPWDEETAAVYWKVFGQQTEKWLDDFHGECLLRRSDCAAIVSNALQESEGKLCSIHSFVVMPNHVHSLFSTVGKTTLPELLKVWKGRTSRAINRILGRTGAFWQKDYFDRLVRATEHFWRCARYIRKNPANLPSGHFLLWEADCVAKALDM